MRESDWWRKFLLRSDWLLLIVAPMTTFFPSSICHAARIFVMKHGLLIVFFMAFMQTKSLLFFGLFVSFLNCVYCLVFYMYHSTVTVSNLYFHVNIIR